MYFRHQYHPKVRYILFGKYQCNQAIQTMPDFKYNGKVYYNPVQLVMEQIGGTWKAPILWRLKDNTMRYGELRKDIPHISDKMLTTQLRELEEDGYIHREVYAVVPPKTEYSLTAQGKDMLKLITTIRNYGLKMMAEDSNQSEGIEKRFYIKEA
jgi:DNA-binding HxlR family transcriptional regulator